MPPKPRADRMATIAVATLFVGLFIGIAIMIIEWRKGGKSLFGADKSALQKAEGAFCFYIIATEIVKFRERNLLANQRFAVEILKFRLSIVVIIIT